MDSSAASSSSQLPLPTNQEQAIPAPAIALPSSSGQDLLQWSGGIEVPDKEYGGGGARSLDGPSSSNGLLLPLQTMSSMNQFGAGCAGDDGGGVQRKQQRPLVRKIKIPASVLGPYRLLIFVRVVVLGAYLSWRITNKNEDAVWLWGMSVICEFWFTFSWLLEQLPKLRPVKRAADVAALKDRFESASPHNPLSDLPGIDVFVAVGNPNEKPPLIMANTLLSILAADYPVEKLSCYLSDDAGSALTFEAVAEVAAFAAVWVPFCRKHEVEPRAPESYFSLTKDPYRNKVRRDFVSDRRTVKREYEEFKIRINALPDSIGWRSEARNALEERKAVQRLRELYGDEPPLERPEIARATWMANGCHWPGTWIRSCSQHSHGDHSAIVQMILKPPSDDAAPENSSSSIDLADVDIRLPMLLYVARERQPGYEDNKKAGAMNALVRASAVISNGPFVLNLDSDNYVYNSAAFREGMCYMMDPGGERVCFVQFPQRFEGVDPSDRYANHNNVFFDVNMRALDGVQGPIYLGSGCLFRRMALYGFDAPPLPKGLFGSKTPAIVDLDGEDQKIFSTYTKRFGNSNSFIDSIPVAEFGSRPPSDHPKANYGRPPGALAVPRDPVTLSNVAEAMSVIACSYEDRTQWGERVGWIYGSAAEDEVVTGYRMHNRGWRSAYCAPAAGGGDAFRSTAPINLTDRLQQILRRAAGAVEFFFSRSNAMLVSPGMKTLQRLAYLNLSMYPFTSIFLTVYCLLPALCLFSGQFIAQTISVAFLTYILTLTVTLCVLAMLEIKWSGVHLVDWWRNEQLWVMGNTSAYLVALFQGMLKALTGIDLLDGGARKPAAGDDDDDDEFAELYVVKWTWLMVPPVTIMMVNLVAMAVGVSRTIYSSTAERSKVLSSSAEWSKLLGGLFFSLWVLIHLYPFAKGLMGKREKAPTVVFIWSGLIAITVSLLWVAIKSPSGNNDIGGSFTFP